MLENLEEKSDEELVAMILLDQSYFASLIKRYESKLLCYILRISNTSYEEAEDILQDVFIKIYQNINDFDEGLKFSSWAYRITHNQVISNFRKNKARPQHSAAPFDDELINKLASNLDIEKEINIKILRKNIDKALSQLDVKYKEILILKYFEGKDYKEISDILKKPMGTVASILNRAKRKFLEKYKLNI